MVKGEVRGFVLPRCPAAWVQAGGRANDKRPERAILFGLFFLKTALMKIMLTVRSETWNPVAPAFFFPPDYCSLSQKSRNVSLRNRNPALL
jgi:hypothetical protein